RDNISGPVYISGELINNDPAMAELAARGLDVLRIVDGEEPPQPGTLIMRAHGEPPSTFERAAELGLPVIDATCGIVRTVQKKAEALEQAGWQVILYGHRSHPESQATIAYTGHGLIVESLEEANALPHYEKIAALAQTTILLADYERICEVLKTKTDQFQNEGQVCAWTRMAQEEAEDLAQRCTVMVVVGGRKSSNTHRLAEVCSRHVPSHLVEIADEVDASWFAPNSIVGVCAGASTREADVSAVIERIQAIGAHLVGAVPA
ncbi:MAG TPA: 4-hydroxy-3-methylbut-2-enyl diphosphate reductase, partial [Chloroflexota bacterium]